MTGVILIAAFVLLIGPLAVLYGADSRSGIRDERRWWPGASRKR